MFFKTGRGWGVGLGTLLARPQFFRELAWQKKP